MTGLGRRLNLNEDGHLKLQHVCLWSLWSVILSCVLPAKAEGIPEPSMILYGVVTDSTSGTRVTFGTLQWSFRPAGGTAFTLSTTLTNINDQFSYVLQVPCETEIVGVSLTPGVLKLGTSTTTYDRSQVQVHGTNAVFVQPNLSSFTLAATDRGVIERIDLSVALGLGSSLPEAWQLQYFGQTGVDPNGDPDQDGMTNLQEYTAGTHPVDGQSRFGFVRVARDPAGGVRVEWPSAQGKVYAVQRSGSLTENFLDLQIDIAATVPLNTFRDATATGTGPYFYRLRVE